MNLGTCPPDHAEHHIAQRVGPPDSGSNASDLRTSRTCAERVRCLAVAFVDNERDFSVWRPRAPVPSLGARKSAKTAAAVLTTRFTSF